MTRLPLVVALLWSLLSCSDSTSPRVCVPGATMACLGPGACMGAQRCDADGNGYGECDCGTGTGGGSAGGLAGGTAGGSAGGTGGGSTAGGAGGGTGGGTVITSCELVAQTGCPQGERCAVSTREDSGVVCAPPGAGVALGSCSYGVNGYDTCGGGLVCATGQCKALCDPAADAGCGPNYVCNRYQGAVANTFGACDPTCDPVTQVRLPDSAPACGSVDGGPALGCYSNGTGSFACGRVIDPTRTHGTNALGPANSSLAYLNGCAAGFLPALHRSTTDAQVICVATCRPGATSVGNTGNALGVSPYTCAARGATGATTECRYLWFFQSQASPAHDEVGVCFDYTSFTWDHDRDAGTAPVAYPSCTTLPATDLNGNTTPDYLEWGCGPRP